MKLEVGMYIRTKKGRIAKITNINTCCIVDDKEVIYVENDEDLYGIYGFMIPKDEIIKASHALLGNNEEPCLIEVGDYVNGWKVLYWTDGTKIIDDGYTTDLNKVDIKSIVTKEQFESMSYKVGEE